MTKCWCGWQWHYGYWRGGVSISLLHYWYLSTYNLLSTRATKEGKIAKPTVPTVEKAGVEYDMGVEHVEVGRSCGLKGILTYHS